jgi:hypothetical protein
MLASQAGASAAVQALAAASYAAGANNGAWIDIRSNEGDLLFNIQVGAVTGSATFRIQDATDGSGTGAADITGATTAAISAANSAHKLVVPAGLPRGWVRVINTVVTGPVLASVGLLSHPKYV